MIYENVKIETDVPKNIYVMIWNINHVCINLLGHSVCIRTCMQNRFYPLFCMVLKLDLPLFGNNRIKANLLGKYLCLINRKF